MMTEPHLSTLCRNQRDEPATSGTEHRFGTLPFLEAAAAAIRALASSCSPLWTNPTNGHGKIAHLRRRLSLALAFSDSTERGFP